MTTGSLGDTRSAYHPDSHLLQTPETFVRAPLPGMDRATAIVHISPAAGARFVQYTAEFEDGGRLGPCADQRFVYLLEGHLSHRSARNWRRAASRICRPGTRRRRGGRRGPRCRVRKAVSSRCITRTRPDGSSAAKPSITASNLGGDPQLEVRSLVPEDPAIRLPREHHDLPARRIARRARSPRDGARAADVERRRHLSSGRSHWYPVQAGDFIWMAAYCPQWFGALGRTPAKYLIYKDWSRHPQ